jgi:hypothetical protein
LADRGVFLIDLKPEPKCPGETLEAYVPDLVNRAAALKLRHVRSGVPSAKAVAS